jgi:hypothetical protein
MDCSRGIVSTVINTCTAKVAKASDIDQVFVARLGLQSSSQVLLVPVLLKERVAALLMALSEQSDDLIGLELLVQVAQQSLDLQSYRKAVPPPPAAAPRHAQVAEPPRPAPVVQRPEPAAAAPAPVSSEPATATATVPRPTAEPVYAAVAETAIAPSTAATQVAVTQVAVAQQVAATQVAAPAVRDSVVDAPANSPVVNQPAHEKARRFAKLLVEEIKLYNQTKVAEGRARGDLYSRLREDIEKSRAAYHKRYGESVSDVDYFTQELMRILADNNRAVMGAGFPG